MTEAAVLEASEPSALKDTCCGFSDSSFQEDMVVDSEELPITLVEPPLTAFCDYFEPIMDTHEDP